MTHLIFDEGGPEFAGQNLHYLRQHKRFVKFLERQLEDYRKKDNLVDKLRFNSRLYLGEDATIIGRRWLELAFERGVKELEISWPKLPSIHSEEESEAAALIDNNPVCWLPWMATFDNAKSLTSLKLDGVRFTCFRNTWKDHDYGDPPPLLPSLKTLSLKSLRLDDDEFALLLATCPSLEHLSLIDFRFLNSTLSLRTLTLKSLEFMHCEMPTLPLNIYREQADIIESFTWVGACPSLEYLSLTECSFKNFKCHISNSSLKSLEVKHCSQLQRLQVDQAQNLESFTFHLLPDLSVDDDLVEFCLNGCHPVRVNQKRVSQINVTVVSVVLILFFIYLIFL